MLFVAVGKSMEESGFSNETSSFSWRHTRTVRWGRLVKKNRTVSSSVEIYKKNAFVCKIYVSIG